jgi:hypothetical protein
MKLLGFLFVFFVMPPLGYLVSATVFTHFGDQVDVRDTRNASLIAVARSCAAQEPITLTGGFKTWYICQADVSANGGPSRAMEARGFLNPSLVGVPVEVGTTHKGTRLVPEHQRYPNAAGLLLAGTIIGWLALMIVMLWLLSRKHMPPLSAGPDEIRAHVEGRNRENGTE